MSSFSDLVICLVSKPFLEFQVRIQRPVEGQVCQQTPPPREVLTYKSDEGACREISRTPLKGTRTLFYGRVPNSFPSLRGTNSIIINHITGTAILIVIKITFEHFLFKDVLKVLSLIFIWEQSFQVLASKAVPIHKFEPLKATTSTPLTFIGEYPPGTNHDLLNGGHRRPSNAISTLCRPELNCGYHHL